MLHAHWGFAEQVLLDRGVHCCALPTVELYHSKLTIACMAATALRLSASPAGCNPRAPGTGLPANSCQGWMLFAHAPSRSATHRWSIACEHVLWWRHVVLL
jgi:hypothetical protein